MVFTENKIQLWPYEKLPLKKLTHIDIVVYINVLILNVDLTHFLKKELFLTVSLLKDLNKSF